jgi:tetratricopeptide (TPR) repeat protein
MKKDEIPFNMNFTYGNDLREVPDDPEQMRKGVDYLKEKLEEEQDGGAAEAALRSQLAGYCRIMGDLELAKEHYQKAKDILKEAGKEQHIFAIQLRMAIVYQWDGRFKNADEIYSKSIEKSRRSSDKTIQKYLDFALQHYGKSKFEQGQFDSALDCFMEALELRLIKGDLTLIESTQKAIEVTRSKLE